MGFDKLSSILHANLYASQRYHRDLRNEQPPMHSAMPASLLVDFNNVVFALHNQVSPSGGVCGVVSYIRAVCKALRNSGYRIIVVRDGPATQQRLVTKLQRICKNLRQHTYADEEKNEPALSQYSLQVAFKVFNQELDEEFGVEWHTAEGEADHLIRRLANEQEGVYGIVSADAGFFVEVPTHIHIIIPTRDVQLLGNSTLSSLSDSVVLRVHQLPCHDVMKLLTTLSDNIHSSVAVCGVPVDSAVLAKTAALTSTELHDSILRTAIMNLLIHSGHQFKSVCWKHQSILATIAVVRLALARQHGCPSDILREVLDALVKRGFNKPANLYEMPCRGRLFKAERDLHLRSAAELRNLVSTLSAQVLGVYHEEFDWRSVKPGTFKVDRPIVCLSRAGSCSTTSLSLLTSYSNQLELLFKTRGKVSVAQLTDIPEELPVRERVLAFNTVFENLEARVSNLNGIHRTREDVSVLWKWPIRKTLHPSLRSELGIKRDHSDPLTNVCSRMRVMQASLRFFQTSSTNTLYIERVVGFALGLSTKNEEKTDFDDWEADNVEPEGSIAFTPAVDNIVIDLVHAWHGEQDMDEARFSVSRLGALMCISVLRSLVICMGRQLLSPFQGRTAATFEDSAPHLRQLLDGLVYGAILAPIEGICLSNMLQGVSHTDPDPRAVIQRFIEGRRLLMPEFTIVSSWLEHFDVVCEQIFGIVDLFVEDNKAIAAAELLHLPGIHKLMKLYASQMVTKPTVNIFDDYFQELHRGDAIEACVGLHRRIIEYLRV